MSAHSSLVLFPCCAVRRSSVTAGFFHRLATTLVMLWGLACLGQTAKNNGYADAMAQTRANARILVMQDFLTAGSQGATKIDALEVLVWDYKQIGNQQKASEWATKLLDADAE